MMNNLRITYSFSKEFEQIPKSNIQKVDEMTLRYNLFFGNVYLMANNSSIDLAWEWIPILDFSMCLFDIYKSLGQKNQGVEEFDFTESDAILIFRKVDLKVEILASFTNNILETTFESFQKAVKQFGKDVVFSIFCKYPDAKHNAVILNYLNEIEKQ